MEVYPSASISWLEYKIRNPKARLLLLAYYIIFSSTSMGILAALKVCNHTYSQETTSNGNFSSTNFPAAYPSNVECLYIFTAKANFRVEIAFEEFALETSVPKCEHYLDLYAEVEGTFDFPDEKLSGRFCGTVSPGIRISMYNVAALVFHARGHKTEKGFRGTYKFIPAGRYGLLSSRSCDVTIDSRASDEGSIFSPTYPGKYPNNIICKYKLLGEPGYRIRLYLKDFDLYFGGQHCPYDTLTVYDGDSNQYPIIQKLCGLQQTLELFSRAENLYLEFRSTDPPYAEHRGFEILYTFNKVFVDIGKLLNNDPGAEYVRGTECDIRVKSSGESTHYIRSPGSGSGSYPKYAECTYILDGMQGRQKLEHASIEFQSFSVISDSLDCGESNVTLFLNGQDLKEAKAESVPADKVFCSPMDDPQLHRPYESSGSRMIVIFRNNESTGDGFEAKIRFRTDFGISGSKVVKNSEICHFEFVKDEENREKNSFNSPRFPDDYFSSTTCVYDIKAAENQRVYIEFEQFDLHGSSSDDDGGGDRVEIFDAFKNNKTFRLYANYSSLWSQWIPGPSISRSNWVRVVFHSDAQGTRTGFKAYYKFLPLRNPKQPCRSPLSPSIDDQAQVEESQKMIEHPVCIETQTGSPSGIIVSPNFGEKYGIGLDRLWIIKAQPGYRILLEPIVLKVEGIMKPDGMYSQCQQAVIRVYDDADQRGKEFCGDVIKNPGVRQFVSSNETLYVNFITSPYQVMGLDGFNFSWTEFNDDSSCSEHDNFKCSQNGFCISKKLVCNSVPNCGYYDTSDEYKILCQYANYVPPLWINFEMPDISAETVITDKFEFPDFTEQLHINAGKRLFHLTTESINGTTGGPAEEGFKKTTIWMFFGLSVVGVFILFMSCIIARRRWKQKKYRRASMDVKYGSSIIRRHLTTSSIRSRQLASQPDFI